MHADLPTRCCASRRQASLTLPRQDDWTKRGKKQSKESKAALLRARLDPDNERNLSAKEVMDARAKNKRKATQMEDEDEDDDAGDDNDDVDVSDIDGVDKERPGQGLKKKEASEPNKRQKINANGDEAAEISMSEKRARSLAKKQARLESSPSLSSTRRTSSRSFNGSKLSG